MGKLLITEFRKKKDMTQLDLANESGVSIYTVKKMERMGGRFPNVFTVVKLARALECTVEDLVVL